MCIRDSIKGIPVIVVSAKVDIDNKVDLLLEGAVDYVTDVYKRQRYCLQHCLSEVDNQSSHLPDTSHYLYPLNFYFPDVYKRQG